MSAQSRVTCVIPVFNGERYLSATIESVLQQTGADLEIIVVDDGSTDGTRAVAERFGNSVHYVYQVNNGPASARNRGIEMASGEFIAFLDADDLWHPRKTQIQLARFAERPELMMCTAHMQNFLSEDKTPAGLRLDEQRLEQSQPGIASTLVTRASLFDTVGVLDVQYKHRDIHDLMVRTMDRGFAVETLPDVLVQRRIHENNLSHNRGGADQMELVVITRARLARRRAMAT